MVRPLALSVLIFSSPSTTPNQYVACLRDKIREGIKSNIPIIAIIPKQDAHIFAMKRVLRECLTDDILAHRGDAIGMAVLDDEADDSSVLDAKLKDKLTPLSIQDLWSLEIGPHETINKNLFACYIAYTATPQANFLQESHNPLAPKDFAAALRTPGSRGALTPRSSTYTEPGGITRYYTGGDIFYGILRGQEGDFCRAYPFPEEIDGPPKANEPSPSQRYDAIKMEMLGEAIRAYLVAGAIRLRHSGKSISSIQWNTPCNIKALTQQLPDPHSMLYHPSGEMNAHFQGAREIAAWSKELSPEAKDNEDDDTEIPQMDPNGLCIRLAKEEQEWKKWLDHYRTTGYALRGFPLAAFPYIGSDVSWDKIKETLIIEIFPNTKTKVLNSDPKASDRPSFSVIQSDDDQSLFFPPNDLLSIFVAGNVLSRGVTLEGLTTSLFLRGAKEPAADTQMQMQRWFGYRGSFLPLCRLFLFRDQLDLFRAYHDTDESIKDQILKSMELNVDNDISNVVILQGEGFWATKKVRLSRLPLHPGPSPSIKLIEQESEILRKKNLTILDKAMRAGVWHDLNAPAGTLRGRIREDAIDMLEVASILESFEYTKHKPNKSIDAYRRWDALSAQFGLQDGLLRLPNTEMNGIISADPASCPYSIAAFLRLWAHLSSHPETPGFYPTDNHRLQWKMVDRARHLTNRPVFYVAVRFGNEGPCTFPLPVPVQCMRRGLAKPGLLQTLWGTRGHEASYLGDEFLDYHFHGTSPAPALHSSERWRRAGHPGLLLFHVIRNPGENDSLAVGLSIPHGGPDHIAALRT